MSQFYSNEATSFEQVINIEIKPATVSELIDETYELPRCLSWIQKNDFKKVCLQFPDHLLQDAAEVALRLKKQLGYDVYILGDSAYESCCIDFIAAAHINADCIIHYGPTCFSKSATTIPFLYVYEKNTLNLDDFYNSFKEYFVGNEEVTILLDTCFKHLTDKIVTKLEIKTVTIDSEEDLKLQNKTVIFLGDRNQQRKLPHLKFLYKPKSLYFYNPDGAPHLVCYEDDRKILKRRFYLIEKIKDSRTIGIIVGTLGVKNYLQAIERLKTLLTLNQKKFYLLSVGKPTVAKLANFPEIDIFVAVTCALNELFDSRDFYKPIVTTYDIEMALNPLENPPDFSYDYNSILLRPINDVISSDNHDVSLLTGMIRGGRTECSGSELVTKEAGIIALNTNHGAGFLAGRSWKGLERHFGEGDVKMAEEGRCGIAQHYQHESS